MPLFLFLTQVNIHTGTPSKELLSDARNRSSVEVEQILPLTEHIPDPRDFYASDSPALDGNFDSDQGLYESAEEFPEEINPEVQLDDEHPRVCLSYSTYTHPSHTNYCNTCLATSDTAVPAFACTALDTALANCPSFILMATNELFSEVLMS